MDLLKNLNDKQREAAENINGPLLILAGAGSGKTRTIIHRIANIIEKEYARPGEILALTFTNKAAGEMKERIEKFGFEYIEDMWMGTFHSICARILRFTAHRLGEHFNSTFSIYDEDDSKKLISECIKELDLSERDYPPAFIKETISSAKNKLMESEEFFEEYEGDFKLAKVGMIYKMYQEKLEKNNAMDFDDLLLNVVKVFHSCPDVLEKFQERFKYILVDEYQDTNYCQYVIVSLIAKKHRNICVCGDDDQSIYGWRGADIRNILEFKDDFPDARVIKLEQNYRCTKNILDAANHVIAHNQNRTGKYLWTQNEQGEKVTYLKAQSDLDESAIIARQIRLLHQNGVEYDDIAVLYRVNAQSRTLEEGLMRRGIPYQIIAGTKFYDRMEIKDILAYLKLLVNPKDDIALSRIINMPRRGIGAATVEKLREYTYIKGISMMEVVNNIESINILKAGAKDKILGFKRIMDEIRDLSNVYSLTDTIKAVMQISGYDDLIREGKIENAGSRKENLEELINAASDFERSSEDASIEAFLENAALVAGVDSYDEDNKKVLLMTLHNAKGLEFKIVFMPGMEEGLFPMGSIDKEEELEEERRLCYVGITRAREKLYVCSAKMRRVYGETKVRKNSRFLEEIPIRLIENGDLIYKKEKSVESSVLPGISYDPYKNTATRVVKAKKPKSNGTVLSAGDKISHAQWGNGTVVGVSGDGDDAVITAAFPGLGIKKFMAGVASFKKI